MDNTIVVEGHEDNFSINYYIKEHDEWVRSNRQSGKRVHFLNLEISGSLFRGKHLEGIIFENCNLQDSTFKKTWLNGAQFINCKLDNTDFSKCSIAKTNFLNCNIEYSDMIFCYVCDSKFSGCAIDYLDIEGSDIRGVDLSFHLMQGIKWFSDVTISKEQLPWLFLNKNFSAYQETITVM